MSLILLRFAGTGRAARARASRLRALRRGIEVGGIAAIVSVLQLIGGLTPLTALFVVLSFAIAEYVMSAGASPSS
ncbi:MAG: hypothetical protein KGK34_06340 [Chloroflexota bacterium]|nr:hypothetical protein [Chloroflexota bacterium]